ncbi:MAG TPA: hypothetical protein DD990_34710 [Cyanobacteria bacterium UBA11368]|nr:hypothetical protein [Cyanobacteria bacterium UBA11368]
MFIQNPLARIPMQKSPWKGGACTHFLGQPECDVQPVIGREKHDAHGSFSWDRTGFQSGCSLAMVNAKPSHLRKLDRLSVD